MLSLSVIAAAEYAASQAAPVRSQPTTTHRPNPAPLHVAAARNWSCPCWTQCRHRRPAKCRSRRRHRSETGREVTRSRRIHDFLWQLSETGEHP